MKIAINTCYGGFSLSNEAVLRYAELKGIKLYTRKNYFNDLEFNTSPSFKDMHYFSNYDMPRDSIELIQTIEELGVKANGRFASLKIIEIPDDVKWQIEDYDGLEHIAEQHRTWS